MGFFSGIKDTALKLKYAVANPGQAAGVVSKAVSNVLTGRPVPVTEINRAEAQAAKITIGKALAAPIALAGGAVAGQVSGVAASFGKGRISDAIAEHPIASAAGLLAVVAAPGAVLGLGAAGIRGTGSVAAASIVAADDDEPQPRKKAKKKPAKKKAKKKPKKKVKKKKKASKR